MWRILFKIPIGDGIPIYAYGVMAITGFIVATTLTARLARKNNIDPNHVFDLAFVALISGVVGARILFVIQPTDMVQVPFRFNFFNVFDGRLNVFGALVGLALGVLLAYWVMRKYKDQYYLQKLWKRPAGKYAFIGVTAVVVGLLAARALYLYLHPEDIFKGSAPRGTVPEDMIDLRIFRVWEGGLVWYGGLIFAFVCSFIFVLMRRLPILTMMDIGAPHIALGLAFGRIGCFLNGCCWGKPSYSAWHAWCTFPKNSPAWTQHTNALPFPRGVFTAEQFPNVPQDFINHLVSTYPNRYAGLPVEKVKELLFLDSRIFPEGSMQLIKESAERSHAVIPTQLISILFALGIFGLLMIVYRNRKRGGQVMLGLGFLYPLLRLTVEYMRADNNAVLGDFTISQSISIGVMVVSFIGFLWMTFGSHPPGALEGAKTPEPPPRKKKK